MANVINRTTKQLILSANTPDYNPADWIINPDLSNVSNQPLKYWVIENNDVRLATVAERAVIDKLEPFQNLTVQQAKDLVGDYINTYREQCFNTGVIFKGYLFDSDQRARENVMGINNAITVGYQIPANFTWRSHDNHDVPMTATELVMFGTGMMVYVSKCYGVGWYHKDTIAAMTSTNMADYANYNYTVGWPNKSIDGTTLI